MCCEGFIALVKDSFTTAAANWEGADGMIARLDQIVVVGEKTKQILTMQGEGASELQAVTHDSSDVTHADGSEMDDNDNQLMLYCGGLALSAITMLALVRLLRFRTSTSS